MRYVGMDIHAKTTTFCILDDEGKVYKRGKVQSIESSWRQIINVTGLRMRFPLLLKRAL
jgi:hypothetical protein